MKILVEGEDSSEAASKSARACRAPSCLWPAMHLALMPTLSAAVGDAPLKLDMTKVLYNAHNRPAQCLMSRNYLGKKYITRKAKCSLRPAPVLGPFQDVCSALCRYL